MDEDEEWGWMIFNIIICNESFYEGCFLKVFLLNFKFVFFILKFFC